VGPLLIGSDISPAEATRLCAEGFLVRSVCDVVVPADVPLDDAGRAACLALLMARDGIDTGVWVVGYESAAWVHTGAPARGGVPERVELLGPRGRGPRYQSPIVHRQCHLAADEVRWVGGIRVTSPDRTGADLARMLPAILALRALERLRDSTGTTPQAVANCLSRQRGVRGVTDARHTVQAWLKAEAA
jgi:hypothetical protein